MNSRKVYEASRQMTSIPGNLAFSWQSTGGRRLKRRWRIAIAGECLSSLARQR